jgi:hypothetical protein
VEEERGRREQRRRREEGGGRERGTGPTHIFGHSALTIQ